MSRSSVRATQHPPGGYPAQMRAIRHPLFALISLAFATAIVAMACIGAPDATEPPTPSATSEAPTPEATTPAAESGAPSPPPSAPAEQPSEPPEPVASEDPSPSPDDAGSAAACTGNDN